VYRYATHNPLGTTVLSTGQLLRPWGRSIPLARWPNGLAVSPDGGTIFVACGSCGELVHNWRQPDAVASMIQPPAAGGGNCSGGCTFTRDSRTIYWCGGESGEVFAVNAATGVARVLGGINGIASGVRFTGSFPMSLCLGPTGHHLFVADVTNFRVVSLDTASGEVVASIPVGRYPYALALVGRVLYVANIGMYRYHAIVGASPGAKHARGLSFPAFGVPSPQAANGVDAEGQHIPGLGPANGLSSFSVWGIDISSPRNPQIVARIKTGLPVGAKTAQGPAVGGSGPNYLLAAGTRLYVSDNNDDLVQSIDTRSNRIVKTYHLDPSPLIAGLRGLNPCGMALSPDRLTLYVAQAGINALAVINTRNGKRIGEIPTAWFPYRVAAAPGGKTLAVICFRGFGNGPSGGSRRPTDPFMNMAGVLTVAPVPVGARLSELTHQVLMYNGIVNRAKDRARLTSPVIPTERGVSSHDIRYVVFIDKENHTFDTIFDHIPGASSDSSLLRWGWRQTVRAAGEPTLHSVAVMKNHNLLAQQFAISDNYYMEPEYSGVGHRWLVDVQPNNWCQLTYTLGWDFSRSTTAPGRLASFGSSGSLMPEDYPEAGSMWDHLARGGVSFRNYGEGFEFAGVDEDGGEAPTGARETVNIPMPEVLFKNTCRSFPIFNLNIPDVFRVTLFERDVEKHFGPGKAPWPSFIDIALCSDHGTAPEPKRGYPYVASWMADDDEALGQLVQYLSHTPEWRHMAIFVTEDDSGGEPDHIDAQRSVMLVISPWAKRHYVSHVHTFIPSEHKTLYEIFGLGPLNLFDALSNDLADCFTTTPDYTPYIHEDVDPRLFDYAKTVNPLDPQFARARLQPGPRMDDPLVEQRVLENR
ncbi:MAG: bifunctional YncE family protein/alkaline phosphatase family protein, partial [Armatimonadetes bacterium]|nr:bifunctional YncE family protein/alkaline phosphatase family protein [Armatimonadota bacterium]